MHRVAMISAHGCPLAALGNKETGGMNVYVRELSRQLGRKGFAVDVFTRCVNPFLPRIVELDSGVRVIHLQAGETAHLDKNTVLSHLPDFVGHVCNYKEEQRLEYHLVHSHYWLSGWAGSLLAAYWEVPHITMFHTLGQVKNHARPIEGESQRRIEVERRVMARAHRIVASSEHERKQMVRLYRTPPEKIEVIPCGVDLEFFRGIPKEEAKQALSLRDRRVLVFVGRVEPLKGVDILLRVLQLLSPLEDLHLLVIGGDLQHNGEVARLQSLARRLGLQARVSFLGALPQESLPLYYSAAEACVVPSYYESFCLVALEALACGTPVVAARVGGLPSVVADGVNGLLATSHQPRAFAAKIEQLLSNTDLQKGLTSRARPSVEALSWSWVADQITGLYRSLVAPLRPPACLCS